MNTDESRAVKTASTFRQSCAITTTIAAPPERVWALLTNAADFPRWNSTVTRLDGEIALGKKLALQVPISKRTFTPTVVELEPNRKMVWSDGMAPFFKGVRTFTLTPAGGETEFSMVEVLAGITLPMARSSLPDFAPAFEQYAKDLKREAERPV